MNPPITKSIGTYVKVEYPKYDNSVQQEARRARKKTNSQVRRAS